jgi:hypothetical protein
MLVICQGKSMGFLGALGSARIPRLIGRSYERSQAAGVLHRRRSEALLSVAEAQVQHASTPFALA